MGGGTWEGLEAVREGGKDAIIISKNKTIKKSFPTVYCALRAYSCFLFNFLNVCVCMRASVCICVCARYSGMLQCLYAGHSTVWGE